MAGLIRIYSGPSRELRKIRLELNRALTAYERAQRKVLAVALAGDPDWRMDAVGMDLRNARERLRSANRAAVKYRVRVP